MRVQHVLAIAFTALERGEVLWCVLRGETELGVADGDVDLLVAEGHMSRASAILAELGYAELRSWGRGSHRFFLTYDEPSDTWIKLDIVTRLAFGASGELDTGLAATSLSRRTSADGFPLLERADRFWALLLHCLLDRSDIPERHRDALVQLMPDARTESPLATWFEGHVPIGWSASRVREAVGDGRWTSVEELSRAMRAARPRPLIAARRARGALLRRLSKLRTLLFARGIAIALLGPDGAGKSTLADGLTRTFYAPVRTIYMGLYGAGPAGRPPGGFLGRVGRQWSGYLRGQVHRARGRLVVYDRWGYDARLQAGEPGARSGLRRWLLAHAVPEPDLVILLDAPAELLFARKREHDLETLRAQRAAYLALAKRLPSVRVVAADSDANAVRRAVTAMIWDRLRKKRLPRGSRTR